MSTADRIPREVLLRYWRSALAAEFGYEIEIAGGLEERRAVVTDLYNARKGHADLADLMLVTPQGRNVIMICKRTIDKME